MNRLWVASMVDPGGYPVAVPLGESVGGIAVAPAPGRTCPDCGSARFTVTNRRIACLPCYVFVVSPNSIPVDKETRLYENEIILGYVDFKESVMHLDRPPEVYEPPAETVDLGPWQFGPAGHFDRRGCLRPARAGYAPIDEPPIMTPAAIARRKSAAKKAAEHKARAIKRPDRRKRFADDPDFFGVPADEG